MPRFERQQRPSVDWLAIERPLRLTAVRRTTRNSRQHCHAPGASRRPASVAPLSAAAPPTPHRNANSAGNLKKDRRADLEEQQMSSHEICPSLDRAAPIWLQCCEAKCICPCLWRGRKHPTAQVSPALRKSVAASRMLLADLDQERLEGLTTSHEFRTRLWSSCGIRRYQ